MLLIGLGYKARQGKTTAALAMKESTPLDCAVHVVSFADSLRKEVATAIRQASGAANLVAQFQEAGLMPEWVHAETWPDKQRTILQWWGTDYRRAKDPDYWVRRFFESVALLNPDVVIVPDVRFPNEANAIKAAGGVVVKVTRTTAADVAVPGHESESAMDGYSDWDYHLVADTADELKTKAARLYAVIARKA